MKAEQQFRLANFIVSDLQTLNYKLFLNVELVEGSPFLSGVTPKGRPFVFDVFIAEFDDEYEHLVERIIKIKNDYPNSDVALGLLTPFTQRQVIKKLLEPLFIHGIRLCYLKVFANY
ncbi:MULTISPECIES: hypothetical protein [Vibrio]|uniref:Uncharacterized protein n=1 Tax=Vibrio mediterranei TaxID=689 RepID=A0A3G4VBP8_9VIBR|nr:MULTISPECIES: hypothetical protein [Vibrio]AYV22130.1 hypothetical protein ECB94_13075 [Vibrio mediterranei]MDA0109413.1 hypothetical protein [Vibrio sp. La 4.2.2]USE01264.1 hypothetical protein JKJ11_04085 [Vibrio sp. SCSIO 43133]|eukprot:TRINITY_DN68379_c0_g1_i1.p1 TRINITY_DN68379_c0_g1~~TRINITY_DN68379_c0_g1_i1.p1  ORF type:complete len:117 (-),score=4.91 TRINITY_DN68379_c0_g1_i1:183-533(-)